MIRAFVVDDEPLAVSRLCRMLRDTGRVEIAGSSSDPEEALRLIPKSSPDVLFMDIQMPGLNGFETLALLQAEPLVVFTTAYDRYALEAFSVNSVDYLLKPVEPERLLKALNKIDRIRGGTAPRPELREIVRHLTEALESRTPAYPDRISSKLGEKVEFVELARVTHFYAKDKLTYAATAARDYCVDYTIQDLEQRLDPRKFVRVHRSTIVNIEFVHELHTWFAGRMLIKLKDAKATEITVSRERVKELKDRLGL